MFEAAKTTDGNRKVATCPNGRWHIDHHQTINGIPYLHLSFASYDWLGGKYKRDVLSPDLAVRFFAIARTAMDSKSPFTVLEVDPMADRFLLHTATAAWSGPSPAVRGYPLARHTAPEKKSPAFPSTHFARTRSRNQNGSRLTAIQGRRIRMRMP